MISEFYTRESVPNSSLIGVNSLFLCLFLLVYCYFVCRLGGVTFDQKGCNCGNNLESLKLKKTIEQIACPPGRAFLSLTPPLGQGVQNSGDMMYARRGGGVRAR